MNYTDKYKEIISLAISKGYIPDLRQELDNIAEYLRNEAQVHINIASMVLIHKNNETFIGYNPYVSDVASWTNDERKEIIQKINDKYIKLRFDTYEEAIYNIVKDILESRLI